MLTLDQRIQKPIDEDLCGWIRSKPNEVLNIDASILEIFAERLPDLTLKKLSEIMGFKYTPINGRKVIECSKSQLVEFIKGEP